MPVITNPHTTDEWWSINGVSLHQHGWNVTTVGGSRYDLPPRRGDNIKIPYRPGLVHRPKMPDARTINLVMWITGGYRPNTDDPATDQTLAWNDSWDFLRRLVWQAGGGQFTLTRRWRLTVDGVPTIVSADALGEIADTMTPTMTGRTRADFTMTILLADPFFYGDLVEVPLNRDTPTTVTNQGHDNAAYGNDTEVDLIGPLTNPVITNSTTSPHAWVKLATTIAAGSTVRLRLRDFTANVITGTPTNVLGKVSNAGFRYWMSLPRGDNQLTLTASAGNGSALVRLRPPYI